MASLHARPLQQHRGAVDGVGLVEEVAGRRRPTALTMLGVPSSVMPMNAIFAPLECATSTGGQQRGCRVSVTTLARQELEVRALEGAVNWQPSTGWQPPVCMRRSSVGALVELVVADRVQVQADHVHGLDGRLVVEERRQQRARADEVTGRDDERVAVRLGERTHVGREVLGAACVHGADTAAGAGRRLEVSVEVVEGEELDLDLGALLDDRWWVLTGRAGGQDECRGGGDQCNECQPTVAAHSLSPRRLPGTGQTL